MSCMIKNVKGKIHSYETLGAADGPGLRFVLFMQGCLLRCKYCHNPDSWAQNNGAMQVTAEEISAEIVKYRNYFGKRGGLTVSGGEPLLQLDFLIDLFEIMKEKSISTAIDTSGACYDEKDERYLKLLSLTDLVILDIKHIDDEKCRALTGRSNENTLAFAKKLDKLNVPVWIRQVLVPGLTDDENDLKKTREWIETLKNVKKVEILPYHTLGKIKYEKMGLAYPIEGVSVPSKEEKEKAERILGIRG